MASDNLGGLRRTRVYIAGPMDKTPEKNFPAFELEAEALRGMGYDVVSPHEIGGELLSREECMKIDIGLVLTVDMVVALDGWEASRGALLELWTGQQLGLELRRASTWAEIDPVDLYLAIRDLTIEKIRDLEPIQEKVEQQSILQEAHGLIYGDRQGQYGHPLDTYAPVARIWQAILEGRYGKNPDLNNLSAEDVALMLAGMKLGREAVRRKRDNLTDTAGYVGVVEMIQDEAQRRADAAAEWPRVAQELARIGAL